MKSQSKTFINGFEPNWSNVKLLINNLPTIGITKIDYDNEMVNEPLYGIGNTVIAYGLGNYSQKASIELYTSEIIALQKAAKANGIKNSNIQELLPFDIIVAYERPDSGTITTDILKNCMFTTNSRTMAQGDGSFKTSLSIVCSEIQWGISL